jgi:hypothetical protein
LDFLEITARFENQVKHEFDFELLELHYLPYAFGSGTKSYKINGRNIKITFDGREGIVGTEISLPHEKYESSNWTNIFNGTATDFVDKGIEDIKGKIKN